MIDSCGRNIDYLRISITDRCNLRCIYCMPEEGILKLDREEILRSEEIIRICRVMAELGIRKVKLTGGEPLVRSSAVMLVKEIKAIPGIESVTMTTNGLLLEEHLEALISAGLNGVNISLDTRNPVCFQEITRRSGLEKVIKVIEAASTYSALTVKVNCVPLGISGQEITDLAGLAKEFPVHVRFIEMMPIGMGKRFPGVPENIIKDNLQKKYGKLHRYQGKPLGNGPCRYYEIDGFKGKIGFISAISHKFCENCNRIRLTSQGYLKTCLQYKTGCDLREIIRSGGSDAKLRTQITDALERKPEGHHFRAKDVEITVKNQTETLCMSQIGG